ncbi:MAG: ABC transporter ATP-binding protein, partial [bacterium]
MIRLEKLSKYYKSENNITLGLSKINLELHNKEFVAIVGESGSGKSTLLNVISGIDSYEEGELYFNNEETSHYDLTDWENYRRNNISFVFQNYGLIDSYTVYQNVLAAMVINNQTEEESKQTALDIINQVGLSTHITHKATKLSGGQKQRLAIARALAKDSKVLVADEPTGNLDSTTGSEIIALLKEISKTKLVIMVTHDYEEVKDIVTRKIRVFDGNIVEDTIVNALDYKEEIIEEKENKQIDKSLFFTKRNILSQPKRTFFTFLVTFVMSLLIGLIISGFVYYTNLNTYTDVYNPYFENLNPNRVVVRKDDNSIMSDTDLDILNNYKYT